ncbi:HaeIII family restriction endonuclease [Candidatus Gracilibacteria bacterium]|nr:HaeIII family restriction endonuclease [Candidatus Gracilibacteria bacterium]OIO77070.1 MAG: restriction endonuclease [Candidatus Gracilibacteria bacterium CG1_02_38_174]PIQ11540.1 MAG: restriction endonuclease [Candidatus Gracilibacteria bacterium CG18_big_fil_WC_8_21_14_2_50_38_16]PIQ42278.1 MAG: restriction endonuclease [Candidatus Gracilibacteria bacterium CG12_big_fil_rev_8_21_14_0_65_38_15]
MVTTNSKQMTTGKAFEYALLTQFEEKLKDKTNIEVIKNSSFHIAQGCFENTSKTEQSDYLLTASFAVNFLMDIEPKLSNDVGIKDILQLEILSDDHGKSGDVRDVLAIRLLQKWEIGVSAKNNHNAVKHSRLSHLIDFGEKWLGVKVSKEYFETITPIFQSLEKLRKESKAIKKWSELGDYHTTVYLPILEAFIKELRNLNENNDNIPSNLVSYLIGNKDFYKVIKSKNTVEIQAYNINGTLNLPFDKIEPKYKTPKVPLPTEIIDISFKENSNTTVIITMNNDWTLSFRIHNASSRIESSLKFDINLLKSPKKLFKNTLHISKD